jgi:flavin reductase (DIM6/NTAB) family NADH-FMN oxidoreductase RutF
MDGLGNRFDALTFRRALGQFATGIVVITAKDAEGRGVGVTVNSFTSVSLEPPLVSFCLDRSALSFSSFSRAEVFAVNILAEDQREISQSFARSTGADKFAGVEVTEAACGTPMIGGCLAWLRCRRHAIVEAGDHNIILGEVTDLVLGREAPPLLYFRGRYATLGAQT